MICLLESNVCFQRMSAVFSLLRLSGQWRAKSISILPPDLVESTHDGVQRLVSRLTTVSSGDLRFLMLPPYSEILRHTVQGLSAFFTVSAAFVNGGFEETLNLTVCINILIKFSLCFIYTLQHIYTMFSMTVLQTPCFE